MGVLTATLPWPPSVNHAYVHSRRGVFLSAKGKAFRKRVVALLGQREPFPGPLRLTVRLNPPDRRRRDADNTLKSIQDALQAANAYRDDCQIHELHVFKDTPLPPHGQTHITLETLQ